MPVWIDGRKPSVIQIRRDPFVMSAGKQGPRGATGDAGAQGPAGDAGADGESAYQAWLDDGNTGSPTDFLDSLKGATGDAGPQGPAGAKGDQGDTGPQGAAGAQGPQGDTGPKGDQGDAGAKGDTGDQGPQGEQGETGAAGADGAPGADGSDGADGVGVPAGGASGQVLAKASGADFDAEWVDPSTGGGSSNWGGIGGTLSDQTDLQTALDAKASAAQGSKADSALQSVVAGANVSVDNTDPLNPVIASTGGSSATTAITASESLTAGQHVNVWDDSGTVKVRPANATAEGKEASGFVLTNVASGAAATVYLGGINSALAGLTPAARYYLATTDGAITATAPTASGNVVQPLGIAISTTSLAVAASEGIIIG